MAKFIPDHVKSGYVPDDDSESKDAASSDEMYTDVPGVFVDDEEDEDVGVSVKSGEDVSDSDAKALIIRDVTSILTDAKLDIDEIDRYVKDIDFSLPRRDISHAFKIFAKTDMSIKFELEYLYPVFVELDKPLAIKGKGEGDSDVFVDDGKDVQKLGVDALIIRDVTSILTDAKFDIYEIDRYIRDIDFSLPRLDISRAFRKFANTDMSIKYEAKYLYPVFIEPGKVIIIKDRKVKTATELMRDRTPGGTPVPASYDRVSKDRKLKPENELPQLVTSDALRSKYVKKMMEGKEITCKLCGKVIEADEVRTWWLSIYPAHMDCVHAELNRRAANDGRELPFPE